MQPSAQITGMIDIGSNTVRLAVYQVLAGGAWRIIDQGRWPARLSSKLTPEGDLPEEAVAELGEVLRHFVRICRMHGVDGLRAVATAAIRQARNRQQVLDGLYEETGLRIELLSGEDEARLGSSAMLRTMNIENGFVVDIGGGSTEVTLLLGRQIVSSVSFPIGCVNTSSRFSLGGDPVPASALEAMYADIRDKLRKESWLSEHPNLPIIGLGGTVRALAKFRQRTEEYPYAILHGYEMPDTAMDQALERLTPLPVDKRRKLPGLSKDRADVIVPGLVILRAVLRECRASHIVVCGAGLRDGLFFETCLPAPISNGGSAVLEESVRNLASLYPTAPESHLAQINRLALTLYDRLAPAADLPDEARVLLGAATRLFRVGAVIDFNEYSDHTFYMLMNSHWYGMSHRGMLLTAAIASYRGANSLRRNLAPYRALLKDGDFEKITQLGSLLQLAAALDRSESQAITHLDADVTKNNRLQLTASALHPLPVERMEVETLSKEFKKSWGLSPYLLVR